MAEAPKTFEMFVEQERTRLKKEKEELINQRTQIDEKLANIDREMHAIAAYEAAKAGKLASPKGTRRTRRSGIREAVLATIRQNPNGMSRAEILAAHDAKGDKSTEQSISNALAALKKQGAIVLADGVYTAETAK